MSDNESDEEQQQQMEKIFICADTWHGVFAFLDPFELGLKMALISDRLDVLVDVHFKSRKWSLRWMEIRRATDGNGAEIVTLSDERQPIPEGPLPKNVIGFEEIVISYVDQTVIEFLQRIHPLFDSSGTNVVINILCDQSRSWEIIWQKIWPLINDNICRFLLGADQLDLLRQFSPAILRNCAKLRLIDFSVFFPAFPADDNAEASSDQALTKWLLTPRGDGLPKILQCPLYSAGIEGIKESFRDASKPANFIIIIWDDEDFVPFELKNNLTGERLTFRRFDQNKWLLVRCPIGREENKKWAEWETEAIELDWYWQWNCIYINFKDGDIGDGMDEAIEGPNEPTG